MSLLVCTRLADMTVMHPEQVEKICCDCGHVVGIYPTGQRALKMYPDMKVTCAVCANFSIEDDDEVESAGSIEDIIRERNESKPAGKA